jgi:hypothetical protein
MLESVLDADGRSVVLVAVARTTAHAADAPFPPPVSATWDETNGSVTITCEGSTAEVSAT